MKVFFKSGGIDVQQTPTIVNRAKEAQKKHEERVNESRATKIQTTPKEDRKPKKRVYTRKDFRTEDEYLAFVGNIMKPYLEYLNKNNKL